MVNLISYCILEYFVQDDGLVAVGAYGYVAEADAGHFAHAFEVFAGVFRQVFVLSDAAGVAFPAGECFIDGFYIGEDFEAGGHFVEDLAVVFVVHAHLDFIEGIEDVEARDCHVVDAAEVSGIAHYAGIEPAGAARTAGYGAVFMAAVADLVADFIELLCRERAFADAGTVRFDDADDFVDLVGADAGTGGNAACRGMRCRNVRIRAVFDVEHCSLCAFKHDFLAGFNFAV